MDNGDIRVKFTKRLAALDVRVLRIWALKALNSSGDKMLYVPKIGGRYILTGGDYPDQTGSSRFEIREGRSPRFFVVVSESDGICP